MASLKRYRQTNDSNAAARFRDLPPRFKRQKSVPSPEEDNTDRNKQSQNCKPKKSNQGDSTVIPGSTATIPFHSQSQINKESETSKDKKMLRKGTGTRPFLNVDQNNVRRLTQPVVLSPMDNKLFDLNRNGTHDNQVAGAVNPFSWQSTEQGVWPHYTYNAQSNFSQANMSSYNGTWTSTPNTDETNQYPETMSMPPKDYSETDQRIIEMFKELERVADQKEKEENENGADRKSLVSHHLRMLMCAIDKYTEGIEDETDSNSRDEEVPLEDRSSSPPASKEIVKIAVPSTVNSDVQQPARCSTSPVFSTSLVQSIPLVYMQSQQITPFAIQSNIMPQQVQRVSDSVSPGKPFEFSPKVKPSRASIDMQPWDLWSSPSFNVLDVYSNLSKGHNSSETADSTFALFDQLGMENDYSPRAEEYLTRTPLYKR